MTLDTRTQKLIKKLDHIPYDSFLSLEKIQSSMLFCSSILKELRNEILEKGFDSIKEEIHFFKVLKPEILIKLYYLKELFNIEVNFPRTQDKKQKEFILQQLDRYETFFTNHTDFIAYIELGQNHLDKYYFTRKGKEKFLITSSIHILEDPDFSTNGDLLLSQFRAYEKVILYLKKRIKTTDEPDSSYQDLGIHWIGNKIDLVELIYALHASGNFKEGTEIKELAKAFETLFNIHLGNYYRQFTELRSRKLVARTRFLDSLKSSLIYRMDQADE